MHCLVIVRNFLNVVTFCAAWADCWLYWHSQNKTKHPYTGHMTLTYIQWLSLNRGNKYHRWVRGFRQTLPSNITHIASSWRLGHSRVFFLFIYSFISVITIRKRHSSPPPRKSIEIIFYAWSHFKLTIFSLFTALIMRQVYYISILILRIDQHLI